MAWSNSKIFTATVTDLMNNATAINIGTDALIEVALFDNTITPSQTVTSANTAYGAGVWASGGQTDTGSSAPAGWPSLGRPLASTTSVFATNVYTMTAAATVSANSVTTLSGTYGALIYDKTITTPVNGQGLCFIYFGGVQTVTLGQFTVSWNASGIFTLTL